MHELTVDLHGHELAVRRAGSGPVLLLVHGIAGSNATWEHVMADLAADHTVLAPDLPGHGASGSSSGDYSVGALAATLRDLLVALELPRATIVGHSLGGGVAMQFSYLFPQHAERLVLISSGGLGKTVNPVLRGAALPGAELVTAGLGVGATVAGTVMGPLLSAVGAPVSDSSREVGRSLRSLASGSTRSAFHATLRAVVGSNGQRVFAGDRLYLAREIPTLIVWGDRDPMIPVGHARRAHAAMPGSRLEVLADTGHFPPLERPAQVVDALRRFLAETEPATADPERFGEILRAGAAG